jgi:acetyl esterase/lipase
MREHRPFEVFTVKDLVYASPGGKPLLADLYIPKHTEKPPHVILWLHGGGWRFGDRRMGPDLSRYFAEWGFAMASIDYRLSTEAIFPAQIEDVKTAIRWLRCVAGHYGFDASRIGLWGSSSGGHLAALAATSGAGTFEEGTIEHASYSSEVQAVVDGYGPTDFLQMDEHRDPSVSPSDDPESTQLPPGSSASPTSFESLFLGAPIHSCPERVREANPVTYVRTGLAPFFILHGTSDTAVPVHQSELLYDALSAHGNDVTLCLIEGLGHGFLNRDDFDQGPSKHVTFRRRTSGQLEQVTDQPPASFQGIESFFRKHLHANGLQS